MRSRNPFLRAGVALAVILVVGIGALAARGLRANGVFSSADTGFSGVCKSLPVTGVADIDIDAADHLAFLSVMDGRHPGAGDGIYTLDLAGGPKLTRLAGAPADFHPRGIGLYRMPNGDLFLMAVNHHGASARAGATNNNATGQFSVDSFEVTRKDGGASLVPQGTVEGGLLTDPQDVAVAGPNSFYVSNGVTSRNALMRVLQTYGIWPGGDIVYFNGMSLREAVNGLSGARGLALTADGGHLLVAGVTGRDLVSLTRENFTGNLSEAGQLDLPAGPDRLSVEGNSLWVAAHANLSSWRSFGSNAGARTTSQIFRVALADGVPQSAEQIYGNDGSEIAGAAVGAAAGRRLLIGSPLDGKLLDCEMR